MHYVMPNLGDAEINTSLYPQEAPFLVEEMEIKPEEGENGAA